MLVAARLIMADLTEQFNTLLTQLGALQTGPATLAQIQVIFSAITIILTNWCVNDPTVKYKNDVLEVLSMSKTYILFRFQTK